LKYQERFKRGGSEWLMVPDPIKVR